LLFHLTARETPEGNIGKRTDDDIAEELDWDGEPKELIEALVSAGWLDRDPTHRLLLHDWHEHAPTYVYSVLKRTSRTFLTASGNADANALPQRGPWNRDGANQGPNAIGAAVENAGPDAQPNALASAEDNTKPNHTTGARPGLADPGHGRPGQAEPNHEGGKEDAPPSQAAGATGEAPAAPAQNLREGETLRAVLAFFGVEEGSDDERRTRKGLSMYGEKAFRVALDICRQTDNHTRSHFVTLVKRAANGA